MSAALILPIAASHPVRTSEVIRRFNEVFQQHDPSALPELVAERTSFVTR